MLLPIQFGATAQDSHFMQMGDGCTESQEKGTARDIQGRMTHAI